MSAIAAASPCSARTAPAKPAVRRITTSESLRMRITIALRSPPMTQSLFSRCASRGGAIALAVAAAVASAPRPAGAQSTPAPAAAMESFVRDPKIPIDQDYTKQDQGVHDRAVLHVAAGRLSAGVEDGAHAEGVLGDVAGAPGKLPYAEEVYQYMRMLEKAAPARESLYHRQDRRGPRDDRGGDLVGSEHGAARREQGAARQARRSAHDRHERRSGRCARRGVHADLLHHRHDPFARDRRADRADGARLPADRRRQRLHQIGARST